MHPQTARQRPDLPDYFARSTTDVRYCTQIPTSRARNTEIEGRTAQLPGRLTGAGVPPPARATSLNSGQPGGPGSPPVRGLRSTNESDRRCRSWT